MLSVPTRSHGQRLLTQHLPSLLNSSPLNLLRIYHGSCRCFRSAIVQFVDCGIRWTSATAELYTSTTGASEQNIEIEKIVQDLRAFVPGIRAGTQLGSDQEL